MIPKTKKHKDRFTAYHRKKSSGSLEPSTSLGKFENQVTLTDYQSGFSIPAAEICEITKTSTEEDDAYAVIRFLYETTFSEGGTPSPPVGRHDIICRDSAETHYFMAVDPTKDRAIINLYRYNGFTEFKASKTHHTLPWIIKMKYGPMSQ